MTCVPVPMSGIGAESMGTMAGGVIVIWIMSLVFMMKSPTPVPFSVSRAGRTPRARHRAS